MARSIIELIIETQLASAAAYAAATNGKSTRKTKKKSRVVSMTALRRGASFVQSGRDEFPDVAMKLHIDGSISMHLKDEPAPQFVEHPAQQNLDQERDEEDPNPWDKLLN